MLDGGQLLLVGDAWRTDLYVSAEPFRQGAPPEVIVSDLRALADRIEHAVAHERCPAPGFSPRRERPCHAPLDSPRARGWT